jgi:hypothetical protein
VGPIDIEMDCNISFVNERIVNQAEDTAYLSEAKVGLHI